jgi:hypothetical protein
MMRKRWMRWRGGEGEKGRGVPAEGEVPQSKFSHTTPPTQLLRYSYLEETIRNSN